MQNLALFDLDHTLLPIDSDYEWGQFLVHIGVLDSDSFSTANERFYADYQAGQLDIKKFLEFALAPLAQYPIEQLNSWHSQFMQQIIEPAIRPEAIALLAQHQKQEDLICIITATNSFITRPIAQRFGIPHLIATEPAFVEHNGARCYTGQVMGLPSFREGKIIRAESWLKDLGKTWTSFPRSYFYSDSINDLPLLEKVTHPIATNPDPNLRAIAKTRSWTTLDLFL